jgi:hypothetical protein
MTIGPWSAGEILTAEDLNDMTHGDGWIVVGDPGAPAFQNSWASLAGQFPVAFRRVGNMVFLRGFLNAGTSPSVAFTLPSGYRPATNYGVGVLVGAKTTGPASTGTAHTHSLTHDIGFLNIETDGDVVPTSGLASAGTYWSLNNCFFFVD